MRLGIGRTAKGNQLNNIGTVPLEVRAVNATALGAADFVQQRKLERAVAIGGRGQAGGVDVVAEAKGELLIVKARAQDDGIHQLALV